MPRIALQLELRWLLAAEDNALQEIEPLLFELLNGVRQEGQLNYAARAADVSYRHAWGLFRHWEQRLGKPLVVTRKGRGTTLTDLGAALLACADRVGEHVRPTLEGAALEAGAQLSEAADPGRHSLAIASSHDPRMQALRAHLSSRYRVIMETVGSVSALARYRRDEAEIAGFHIPLGELGTSVGAHLIAQLDSARDQIWLVAARTLGLLSRTDRPCPDLNSLATEKLRFVNRQPGSSTRLAFDGLLGTLGIAPGHIIGYDHEEYTHTAVAALVASGSADAGLATEDVARQLQLHFVPLTDERFYIAVRRNSDAALKRSLGDFCAGQMIAGLEHAKPDERTPTVAALKRIHRAGFWKKS